MKRAAEMLGYDPSVGRKIWRIVKVVNDTTIPCDYIEIDEKPLVYSRAVIGKSTTETFEYIDGTYTLTFIVETDEPQIFLQILGVAGEIGILGRTSKGYGKFTVQVKILERKEKEEKQKREK
jgi:hypothetical protein